MKVIGLTGGVASGKSTITKMLKDNGFIVIDSDGIARDVVAKGEPALKEIKEYFGKDVIDEHGKLMRKTLGEIVFNDSVKMDVLKKITHPRIRERILTSIQVAKFTTKKEAVFVDIPLLIESGYQELVDEIWLVAAPVEIQLQRVVNRDEVSRDYAEKIIANQMPLEMKKAFADVIIDNSGTVEDLGKQIETMVEKYQ